MLKTWNLRYDGAEKGATVFAVLFDSLENVIWRDELAPLKNYLMPAENTLLEGLLRDSAYQFLDDVTTPQKETLHDNIIAAFRQALPVLKKAEDENRLHWAAFKDTRVTHLTRLMQFSRLHLNMGGGRNAINATKTTHGPSWRMVVHLTPETEAYGVYPGGQHGNPGSKYYDNFIDTWAKGEYYPLVVMKKNQDDSQVKWTMKFLKSETSKD